MSDSSASKLDRRVHALMESGDLVAARQLLSEWLATHGADYARRCLLGYLCQSVGDFLGAERCYEAAATIAPPSHELFHNLGVVKRKLGDPVAAKSCFLRAMDISPDALATLDELAGLLMDERDIPGALSCYERMLAKDRLHVRAYVGMGGAFADAGWDEDAVRSFSTALALDADCLEALNGLGIVYKRMGRYDEAMRLFERALVISPTDPALLRNRAMLLGVLGRHEDAEHSYRQVLSANPEDADAHFSLGCSLLLTGRLPEGWREYEYRWHSNERDAAVKQAKTVLPRWTGESVPREASGLIIYTEQGFGDAIQFARYVPMVAERFGKVLLHTRRPLVALFQRSFGRYAEVVSEVTDEGGYTHHCPLLSLPLAFMTALDTIPAQVPYLQADAGKCAAWRERLASLPNESGLRVGIAWATGKRGLHKRSFELPPRLLEPLLKMPGVTWISLNKEALDPELAAAMTQQGLIDWSGELTDFDDTAALISALDLVVSVDTAVAHLAGALDRPVWLLNRFESEWRWLLERSDSPWYPSMRIFRQRRSRDWEAPLDEVAVALARLVEA